MKKLLSFILCLCLAMAFASCVNDSGSTSSEDLGSETSIEISSQNSTDNSADIAFNEQFDENGNYIPLNYDFPKLMKLTQWDLSENILLSSSNTPHKEKAFRNIAKTVMNNIKNDGFNTVLLQIRPFADSFYASEYYPLSYFVTGSYANQTVEYDAVQIFIEEAHKLGLSIHGWINPMRCMTNKEIKQLTGDWPITKWYSEMGTDSEQGEYMFAGTDAGGTARLYLNPAYEEVRKLIIDGVGEILDKYHVDGIFMDDYFYPEEVKNKTEIDAKVFANRTDNSTSLHEFRCNSVNTLVRGIYSEVKEHGKDYIYGISPNGHISHAFSAECADIYTWCSHPGYCDIIYPQFYYGMIHGQVSISVLMRDWHRVLTEQSIRLIPVLTLHKAGTTDVWAIKEDAKTEWIDNNDVLLESLTYLLINKHRNIDGLGFFCYQYYHGNSSRNEAVKAEIENYRPIWGEYETLIGKDKEYLKDFYESVGLDLVALGEEWDDRLVNTGRLYPLFEIE